MTKDIADKLRKHLTKPVDTECAVVYLLAEVRKILEADKPDPKPLSLWMNCHWALHVKLTRSAATLDFLRKVDSFAVSTFAGKTAEATNIFREFVYQDTFRSELRQLLADYNLPTDLCDKDEAWMPFLKAYAGVVEDGSLSSESAKNDGLQLVDRVTFTKGSMPLAADGFFPFIVQWDIILKDGRIMRTGFEPKSSGKVLFWRVQIIQAPAPQQP